MTVAALLPPRVVQGVLAFWFEGILANPTAGVPQSLVKRWFVADPEVDKQVADLVPVATFDTLPEHAEKALSSPNVTADTDTLLAAVIVLDQFSRNIFRGTPRAFASDPIARRLAARLPEGTGLALNRRGFKILPLMHSEDLNDQERCVALIKAWLDDCAAYPELQGYASYTLKSAQDHYDLIATYGRFPHRNEILARASTPDEIAYMTAGGNTHGQTQVVGTDGPEAPAWRMSAPQSVEFDSIPDAIAAFRAGEFLVVVDNEDRENEGDLIIAGSDLTPEKCAFLIRYTSGYICVTVEPERLAALNLPLMVERNTEALRTAYTVSVDYKHGTSTGISAADRSATIRALADYSQGPDDFNVPGHVLPLKPVVGGVLKRVGHTEAALDLAKLAGKSPVAALCEVVLDDGRMARRDDLKEFAQKWGFKMITIADLVRYRKENGLGEDW
ncbi:hypothetical protein HDU86_004538 [Geranomyces michiganensis]|nr:hypothetical protein HDU86_004538 [Geranomyces michiganensis]